MEPFHDSLDKKEHQKVAAWFLGPKAENEGELLKLLTEALKQHSDWRREYFPQDPPYVIDTVKRSKEYQDQLALIKEELGALSASLRNSQPFFSSRYKGHMNWEISMVGLLGYFATALYNPNNVVTEGSPATTILEGEVGKDLCAMLGYAQIGDVEPWGHITSCGSVANFDSLWAARNVRYLAVALRKVQVKLGADSPVAAAKVTLADGRTVDLSSLSPVNPDDIWALLNVPADNTLALRAWFAQQLGDSRLNQEIAPFDVQHVGMRGMPGNDPVYLVAASCHYSWPKGGALVGVGQSHMWRVPVTAIGRLDLAALQSQLNKCLAEKIPVLQVVAVIGTTAEGAVDPIKEIVELRDSYRMKGLDFYIHADAAWGGYCMTMIDKPVQVKLMAARAPQQSTFVPSLPLSKYVQEQLTNLRHADSITIDPHKSGYIQYPAGALCFRNKRLRELLVYRAPYVTPSAGSDAPPDPSMGLYGIDGSRAGAAAAATYLHHKVVGLNPRGHGLLLRQANFSLKKIFALLATTACKDDPFRIGQFHEPPATSLPDLHRAVVYSNDEIVHDTALMDLLREQGPDILINTFAVNFALPILVFDDQKRTWNTSLTEANRLVQAISDDLNIAYGQQDPNTIRKLGASRKGLFIIRNSLFEDVQEAVINSLAQTIGVTFEPGKNTEMNFLASTNMDPWPTAKGFLSDFQKLLRQAILRGIGTITEHPHNHGFVVVDASEGEVFGDHLPMFHHAVHNYHLLVKLQFQGGEHEKYDWFAKYREMKRKAGKDKEDATYTPFIAGNQVPITLHNLIYQLNDYFVADLWCGFPQEDKSNWLGETKLRVSDVILNNHFDPVAKYPANEKYYVFGVQDKAYASHCISQSPDFHHLVELVTPPPGVSELLLELGFEVTLLGIQGGYKQASPLVDNFGYPIQYTREEREPVSSSIIVKRNVWFDTEQINAP